VRFTSLAALTVLLLMAMAACITQSSATHHWFLTLGTSGWSERGNGIFVDGDFIYVVGSDSRPIIIKVDTSGNLLWSKRYAEEGHVLYGAAFDVIKLGSYVYVVGKNDLGQLFLIKVNADDGSVAWLLTSKESLMIRNVVTDGTYIYLIGRTKTEGQVVLIAKLDTDGHLIWLKTYNGPRKGGYWVVKGFYYDGKIYILIGTDSFNPRYDPLILTIDSVTGDLIKAITMYKSINDLDDIPYGIYVSSSGAYVVGFTKTSSSDIFSDLFVVKLSNELSLEWVRVYEGPGSLEACGGVVYAPNGNIYVCGNSAFYSYIIGGLDIFVTELGDSGQIHWVYVIGGSNTDYCSGIVYGDQGRRLYIVGSTYSFSEGYSDIFIMSMSRDIGSTLEWVEGDEWHGKRSVKVVNATDSITVREVTTEVVCEDVTDLITVKDFTNYVTLTTTDKVVVEDYGIKHLAIERKAPTSTPKPPIAMAIATVLVIIAILTYMLVRRRGRG